MPLYDIQGLYLTSSKRKVSRKQGTPLAYGVVDEKDNLAVFKQDGVRGAVAGIEYYIYSTYNQARNRADMLNHRLKRKKFSVEPINMYFEVKDV